MDMIEKTEEKPKTFVLPTAYGAAIACASVRSLARTHDLKNINARRDGNRVTVWHGELEEIKFEPPVKKRGRPLGSFKVRRWNDGFGTVGMRRREPVESEARP
jgi:hypothetical protein